jgi:ABC-2 type transport system ATP-binding protein
MSADGSPLRILELTKWFGTTCAIDGLTMVVPSGSCYGLVGPNGSGKSTTLRSVVGLVRPDSGRIEVCGIDVAADVLAARAAVGVVLDPLQLFERLTAQEFLVTLGELRRLEPAVVRERSEELFAVLQLTEDAGRQIAGYSHGMRKKTALAAAVLHRPRLLLLDEPFAALDADGMALVDELLDEWRANGATVLVATHATERLGERMDGWMRLENGLLVDLGGDGVSGRVAARPATDLPASSPLAAGLRS